VDSRAKDKIRAKSLLKSVHSLFLGEVVNLNAQRDPEALEFLSQRQISIPESITYFGIGYSKYETLSMVCNSLPNEDIEILIELGLLFYREDQLTDKFRNRLIFPVYDHNSKLVGFTGRLIKGHGPKWLDIQESFYYNKNNIVFNLDKIKETARKKNLLILVEGALDVHTLIRRGISIAAAPMGTFLTERQAQLIRRSVSRVILMMDPDQAGEKAVTTAKRILSKHRFKVAVAKLPKYDPDRTAREQGMKVIISSLKEASDNGFN